MLQGLIFSTAVGQIAEKCCSLQATGKQLSLSFSHCLCMYGVPKADFVLFSFAPTHPAPYLFPLQGSDDESYVSDVSDNISEDNASVTDNVSRQSRSSPQTIGPTSSIHWSIFKKM